MIATQSLIDTRKIHVNVIDIELSVPSAAKIRRVQSSSISIQ